MPNLKILNGTWFQFGGRNVSNVRFASSRTVTLIPGDGIGPEISAAVQKIFAAAQVLYILKQTLSAKYKNHYRRIII